MDALKCRGYADCTADERAHGCRNCLPEGAIDDTWKCDHCGKPERFNVLCADCEQLVCTDCGRVVCCCDVGTTLVGVCPVCAGTPCVCLHNPPP